MRILVVWEDAHYEPLSRITRRRLGQLQPGAAASFPQLLGHTSRGNGGFSNYVRRTWQNVRSTGLPNDPGAIEHLLCIVDADKLSELLPGIGPAPAAVSEIAAWHSGAERAFERHLRDQCAQGSAPPASVHGIVLRWSKESLVLAAYDRSAMSDHLSIEVTHPGVATYLQSCLPVPATVAEGIFTDTFRRPRACVDGLSKARGRHSIPKNAPEVDDALDALSSVDVSLVCSRTPDIDRIVVRVWELSAGAAPAALPDVGATHEPPRAKKHRKAPKKRPRN